MSTVTGPSISEAIAAATASSPAALDDRTRKVRASAWAVAGASLVFVAVLWNFGFRPLRTAVPSRLFSHFFDVQAESLMEGRLAVPDGAIGFEAFVHDGQEHLYFGVLPALLRLPVMVLVDDRLFGRLTAPSMLLAWLLAAVLTAMIVWRVRALVAPHRALTRRELWFAGAFIVAATGGSPVLYLGALPWVFSEALMWALAMSLGVLFGLLGVLEQPSRRRVAFVGICTLGAVLSRVTAGWACGLAVVAVAVSFAVAGRHRPHRRWAGPLVAAGVAPLAIGIAINVSRFGTPIDIPFESQLWTQISARRREVLADGGVVGPRFLPSTLVNYLRPDGLRFSPIFPFITPPADPAPQVGPALLDMRYRTPSATATMPLLFVLAVVGATQVFRRGATLGASALRIPLLGAMLIPSGMLLVGYITPRYAVEFLPPLILGGAAGMFAVLGAARQWSSSWRTVLAVAVAALVGFGAIANLAIAASAARVREGGSSLGQLVDLQKGISDLTGRPLDGWIDTGDEPPVESLPDRLFVVGDCDAVLVGTGDLYEPWVPIESRPVSVEVTFADRIRRSGQVTLVAFSGGDDRRVDIELDGQGQYRMVAVGAEGGYTESGWAPVTPGDTIELDVSANLIVESTLIDSPGHLYTSVGIFDRGSDLRGRPVVARRGDVSRESLDAVGLVVSDRSATPSGLCRDLLDAAR